MLTSFVASCIITATLSAILGILVYFKGKGRKAHRLWGYVGISTAFWSFGLGLMASSPSQELALFWNRWIHYPGAIFTFTTFLHYILVLLDLGPKYRKYIIFSYLLAFLLLYLNFAGLIADVEPRTIFTFYTKPKLFYPLFSVIFALNILYAQFLLFRQYLRETGIRKNQILYMFLASVIGFSGAASTILPVYNINHPYGILFVPLYPFFMSYAIIKYKLLDIHFVIRKFFSNLFLILFLTGSILFIYYPAITMLKGIFCFIISCFIVFYIPTLKVKSENLVSHLIYKGKYDYLDRLERFVEKMVLITDENELFKDTAKVLIRDMNASSAVILIHDPVTGDYITSHSENLQSTNDFKVSTDSALLSWLKINKEVFVLEESEKILSKDTFANFKKDLDRFGIYVLVPARLDSDIIGIIALGNKTTGEMYTHIDLELLERLGTQLAVALDYKRVEGELRKKQEFEAIGQMAMEISHEIKNLLVPVKTFVQLAPDRKDDPEFMGSFRRITDTNIDVMNRKVEDILFFSKKQRVHFTPDVDINRIVKDAADGMRHKAESRNITIADELGELPLISADSGLMVHVFNNLLLNALDSMKNKTGTVQLRTLVHPSPSGQMRQRSKDWIRVEVKDEGEGIPEKMRSRIFDAFVTTKSVGDGMLQKRGVGLGLSVVKKIVDAHHGIIEVNSVVGKGTTFVIDLAVQQSV